MIEKSLVNKKVSVKTIITVKCLVSMLIVALAVTLPQIFHLIGGAGSGAKWLPMYLPVLIGGCLLGTWWGLSVGILSPLVSFAITLAFGDPMPVASRLPFMMAELAVLAVVSGLFSKKIAENSWMAFPAVLLAFVAGRTFFIALVAIFESISPLSVAVVWTQIQAGLLGLLLQVVLVPLIVIGLKLIINSDSHSN